MKIIICDDEKREVDLLKDLLRRYLTTEEDTLIAYQNSKELMFKLEDEAKADLYILDIDMPEPNGVDIAERIKDMYPHAITFFYTSHTEYAMEGYRMGVKRYLRKNKIESELPEALHYAREMYDKIKKDGFTVIYMGSLTNVPMGEVRYIDKDVRISQVHTVNNGILKDHRSVKELYQVLDRPEFLFVDRGVIINIDYVYHVDASRIIMTDQKEFAISRRRAKEVKNRILEHWMT